MATPRGWPAFPVDAVCTVPGLESSCRTNGCAEGLFCRANGFCHSACFDNTWCTSQQECLEGLCVNRAPGAVEAGPPGSERDGGPLPDGSPITDSGLIGPPETGAVPEDTEPDSPPDPPEQADWVLVRAGRTFSMGSPGNERGRWGNEAEHPVELNRDYWMMRREISQSQFRGVMGYNPSHEDNCPNCPVEQVRWSELAAYANALSAAAGLEQCYNCSGSGHLGVSCAPRRIYDCPGYRLPTEAEWEYAARGGDSRATYNGELDVLDCSPSPTLDRIAWHCGNSGSTSHPVGAKQANAWGLYDMLGNVQEWCHDWLGDYPDLGRTVTDPTGPAWGQERVLRGGSWGRIPRRARAAYRYSHAPNDAYSQAGGRLVRSEL